MSMEATRTFKLAAIFATTMVLLLGTVPRAARAQVTDDNVVQQLQSAKTPADHQALAAYFNAKADAATASAAKHEQMMGVSQRGSTDVWRSHCGDLVKTFKKQATDYHALAEQQEKLAKAGAH